MNRKQPKNIDYEFIDDESPGVGQHLLDAMPTVGHVVSNPLIERIDRLIQKGYWTNDLSGTSITMYTVTLKPIHHALKQAEQTEYLRFHFEEICRKFNYDYYYEIEYTKAGNAHIHALVNEDNFPTTKRLRAELKEYCGFIMTKPVFNYAGALEYIRKNNI